MKLIKPEHVVTKKWKEGNTFYVDVTHVITKVSSIAECNSFEEAEKVALENLEKRVKEYVQHMTTNSVYGTIGKK